MEPPPPDRAKCPVVCGKESESGVLIHVGKGPDAITGFVVQLPGGENVVSVCMVVSKTVCELADHTEHARRPRRSSRGEGGWVAARTGRSLSSTAAPSRTAPVRASRKAIPYWNGSMPLSWPRGRPRRSDLPTVAAATAGVLSRNRASRWVVVCGMQHEAVADLHTHTGGGELRDRCGGARRAGEVRGGNRAPACDQQTRGARSVACRGCVCVLLLCVRMRSFLSHERVSRKWWKGS